MRIHERTRPVAAFQARLSEVVDTAIERGEVTIAESARVLSLLASEFALELVRIERHGTIHKKADEA